jgi:hypothetical protein
VTGVAEAAPGRRRPRVPPLLVSSLLAALLIALHNPPALLRAELWAEDGTEFFRAAIVHGVASLWTPVYGYHLFLARVIAWMATFFPVLWTPTLYAAAALTVNALTCGWFARDGFAWIIPRRGHRILVCGLLAIGPGTGETLLNISNLTTCLALLAIFLLIERPHEMPWPRFMALLLIGLSSGHMVVLLPLILFLWFRTRNRRTLLLFVCLLPIVAANFLGNQRTGEATGLLDYSRFWMAPLVIAENFVLRLFVAPFLGAPLTGSFMQTDAIVFWPVCLAILALAILGLRRRRFDWEMTRSVGLAFLLSVTTFGIIVIVRSYAVEVVQRGQGSILWHSRYAFLPGALATIFWFSAFGAWIRDPSGSRWLARAARAGILVICLHDLLRWHGIYRRRDTGWPESARAIQTLLDRRARGELPEPAEVENVRIHPRDWQYEWMTVTIPASPGRAGSGPP